MSSYSKKEKISIELFSAGLATAFKKMIEGNIETLGIGIKSVKKMNKSELIKLDWGLCILDMFIVTFCCRQFIDEKICDKVLDSFHKYTYTEILEDMGSDSSNEEKITVGFAFQEESKIRYKSYFEAMRSERPVWELCKEAGKNMFGKPVESMDKMGPLMIYVNGHMKFIMDYLIKLTENFEFIES